MANLSRAELQRALESLYESRNRAEFVAPDPLQCVYRYANPRDREIAGLIASGLAYGRVAQIVANVDAVLDTMTPGPVAYLDRTGDAQLRAGFATFQHRWTTGPELADMLIGVRRVLDEYGSLEACFAAQVHPGKDAGDALPGFVRALRIRDGRNSLLPDPDKGAACKRLHLYLRWMVRNDAVDPGCWESVSPALLLVPLDTHMFAIARRLRMTRRKNANLASSREITRVFRRMRPDDPVRYDFVLTRFGIRADLDSANALAELRARASS